MGEERYLLGKESPLESLQSSLVGVGLSTLFLPHEQEHLAAMGVPVWSHLSRFALYPHGSFFPSDPQCRKLAGNASWLYPAPRGKEPEPEKREGE